MNCVRKHLRASRAAPGRGLRPARVVTLTISDVPGDDPSVIASGPTVPDATTCADAGHPGALASTCPGRARRAGSRRLGRPSPATRALSGR
jgi:hypothetical protein